MISSVSSASASSSYVPNTGQISARASTSTGEKSAAEQQADERTIAALAATDSKVRAHEAAHLAAAQGLAVSGASYSYTTGPDGKRYAVSGEVSIDASAADTPAATIIKAGNIRRAALAPADPSAQDQQVAAMASRMAVEASMELSRKQADTYLSNAPSTAGHLLNTIG